MSAAIAAGTCYEISAPGFGAYCPPACETPSEVLSCAMALWPSILPGDTFRVTRILGGPIGARVVEDFGTITVSP